MVDEVLGDQQGGEGHTVLKRHFSNKYAGDLHEAQRLAIAEGIRLSGAC